ncbi:hypothetical protein J437_LFUL004129 [Ladona fulva]|uniref:Uncharacterized protein n=1 Tax=Ladona fulva TaxID=123851 RepID=A0A8K0JXG3_LADFU|nr:hypothetical protein J437_LFUL004129 [Ladona fulva]
MKADHSGHHSVESSEGYASAIGTYGLLCWNLCRYIVDCLLSVLVIGTLVVVVWRGAWNLLDQLLFPEREDWSAWGSLVLGYGLVIFVFSLQVPVQALCSHLQGIWRLIVADLYLFLSFCGTVNVWRGVWNLLNVYFLPALMLFGCSNSILVRGVLLDGEESGGNCVERASETDRELRTVHSEAVSHPLVLANHHKQRPDINETDGTTVPLTVTIGDHIINDTA